MQPCFIGDYLGFFHKDCTIPKFNGIKKSIVTALIVDKHILDGLIVHNEDFGHIFLQQKVMCLISFIAINLKVEVVQEGR